MVKMKSKHEWEQIFRQSAEDLYEEFQEMSGGQCLADEELNQFRKRLGFPSSRAEFIRCTTEHYLKIAEEQHLISPPVTRF